MSHPSIHQLSTSEDEFSEPSTSPKPFIISGYELHPSIIAMDRGRTFSGLGIEDPHHHLQEFEELCLCLVILGMSQETLRWKLFPFSLVEKAEQWYTHNMRSLNGDWEELRDDFWLSFSSLSHLLAQVGFRYCWHFLTSLLGGVNSQQCRQKCRWAFHISVTMNGLGS